MTRAGADSIGGTVRQRAVRELRDRILTGTLQAGTRLDLDTIAEEFGTSRTPVREALLELSFEGLVEIVPRSGVSVVGVSPDATVENFTILAALGGKAAEWAASRITADELDSLEHYVRVLDTAKPGPELIDANWQFHRVINEAARSRHLLSLIGQTVRLIPSNFLVFVPLHDNSEHRELLQLLRAGKSRQARAAAERHFLSGAESLADWLATQKSK